MHTVITIIVILGYFLLIRRLTSDKKVRKVYKEMYDKECRKIDEKYYKK